MVLFGVFVRYDLDADPHWIEKKMSGNVSSDLDNEFYYRYPSKSHHLAGPPAAYPSCPHRAEGPAWPHLRSLLLRNIGQAGARGGNATHSPLPRPS